MKSAPLIAMAMLLSSFTAHATNHLVRINEVMAGLNGDSSIQFVELASECNQKVWGHDNTQSGAMLTFHDAAGLETGRYTFASNPRDTVPTCFTSPVLIATEGFRQLTGVTPDFLMPPLVVPNAGKVCFRKNKNGAFNTTLCVAYGGTAYTGQTEEISGIPVASDLPIIDAISLTRVAEFGFGDLAAGSLSNSNAHFAFRKPTPASTSKSTAAAFENGEGEVSLAQKSDAEQGKALFMRETFAGNGRTCGTCHVPALGFGLTPEAVGVLPDDDALFVNEPNINTLTLIAPTLPSDFKHGSTLTGSLGGNAVVLSGTGAVYQVYGGAQLAGTISDAPVANDPQPGAGDPPNMPKRNQSSGVFQSFAPGNLAGPTPTNTDQHGLEISERLTGPRALIVENINGFAQNSFLRASPSLLNIGDTAPFGLSGEIPNLDAFSEGAVRQHGPRRLDRIEGADFRVPTHVEKAKMTAFMQSIVSGVDNNAFSVERGGTISTEDKTLVAGTNVDDSLVQIQAPFAFSLYGVDVPAGHTMTIGENGVIGANSIDRISLNTRLPSTDVLPTNDPVLFPYWDDLDPSGGGVFQVVLGAAPNRTWYLEWRGVDSTGEVVNFELRLHELSGRFEYVYANAPGASGARATIGAQKGPRPRDAALFSFNVDSVPAGTVVIGDSYVPTAANDFARYATTRDQQAGRALFFGDAKCSVCHNGPVLAASDGRFGTIAGENEAFNTGVSALPINVMDDLPTEQDVGQALNSRRFSAQQLFGIADTAPYFHDASVASLRDAVQFYDSLPFRNSPASTQIGGIEFANDAEFDQIAAFLANLVDLPAAFTRSRDFGTVAVGASSPTQTLVVTDTAGGGLQVAAPTVVGASGDYVVSAPQVDGNARIYTVQFQPVQAGPRMATLEFEAIAGGREHRFGIELAGVGSAEPEISVDPVTLQFGQQRIHDGPTPSQDVVIENNGTAPLTLTQVQVSGAATLAIVQDTGEAVLQPGSKRTVSVRFEPSTAGSDTADLVIASDDASEPTLTVPMSGEAVALPRLTTSGATLPFDPQRVSGGEALKTFTLTNTGSAALEFTGNFAISGIDAADFALVGADISTLPVGDSRELKLRFDPGSNGPKVAQLSIPSNAPDLLPALAVALTGSGVESQAELIPITLQFVATDVAAGPVSQGIVEISNLGGTFPLTVTKIDIGGAHANDFQFETAPTLPLTIGPNAELLLPVVFDPSSAGTRVATLSVASDDPVSPELSITLTGEGVSAQLTTNVTALDFGQRDIGAGASAAQTIQLHNPGGSDTTITNIEFVIVGAGPGADASTCGYVAASDFSPSVLPSQASRTLAVKFDPMLVGDQGCVLRIESDALDSPLDIALHGEGTATAQLTLSPTNIVFASRTVGAGPGEAAVVTVTNTGTVTASITGMALLVVDIDPRRCDFEIPNPLPPSALAPGESLTFELRFDPKIEGTHTCGLQIMSDAPLVPGDVVELSGVATLTDTLFRNGFEN